MRFIRSLAALAVLAATSLGQAQARESIDITVVAGHPPIFLWVKHLRETMIPAVNAELARTGNYEITWNEAYGGTLAKVGQELDTIRDGLADMGTAFSLFSPDKLPLQNISYLAPFHTDDPALVIAATEALQKEIPAMGEQWDRYGQVYLGGGIASDAYQLFTVFPINSIADLKGHRIGTPGASANWLKNTGAVAVSGDLTTYYNSIKTGVFEGAIVFGTAAAPAKLQEVAPYITMYNFGTTYAGGITFNKARWESLPEEVRAAIRTGVEAYGKAFIAELKARSKSSYDGLVANGAKIRMVSPKERAKLAAMLPNLAKGWAATLDGQGLPGTKVLAGFMNKMRDAGVDLARDWDKE